MNTSRRRKDVTKEEPPQGDNLYLAKKPQLLVLEERHDALMAAARSLQSALYEVHILFEETHVAEAILTCAYKHSILLTAHRSARPLAVPQIIELLRRDGYDLPAVYCGKEKVTPQMLSAYKALSFDQVLTLPMGSRSSAHDLLSWVRENAALDQGGVTVVEL